VAQVFAGLPPREHNGSVRVVVTRIEPDGTMCRRMVETAQQHDPGNWDDLAARALAAQPLYRPVPGTAAYHLCVGGDMRCPALACGCAESMCMWVRPDRRAGVL
jgi:hypothetical protein